MSIRIFAVGLIIMFRALLIALACVLSVPATSSAENLTPRQQEIFKTTMSVDGYLTKALHDEFWNLVRTSPNYYPGVERDMAAVLGPMLIDGLEFQKETWASVELSYAARSSVKTDEFKSVREKLANTPDPTMRAQMLPSLQKADAIIDAAAQRKSYSDNSTTLFVTPELIEKVKTGLDASFFRMQKLFNPEWVSKPQEWHLKEARLRVISEFPFVYAHSVSTLPNGVSGDLSYYTLNIDSQNFLGLGSIKFDRSLGQADQKTLLVNTASGSLTSVGVSSPTVILENFRGATSAVATGRVQTADGVLYASVRTVRAEHRDDILMFVAVTAASQVDADTNRESLELATQVD